MIELSLKIIEFYNSIVDQFGMTLGTFSDSLSIYSRILFICLIVWLIATAIKLIFSKDPIFAVLGIEGRKLITLIFFLVVGFFAMTIVEKAFNFIELDITNSSSEFLSSMTDTDKDDNTEKADEIYNDFVKNAGTVAKDAYKLAIISEGDDMSKTLSDQEVNAVDEVMQEFNVNNNTSDALLLSAKKYAKSNRADEKGLLDFSMTQFINDLLFFISVLLQILVRTIRMFLILLCKFSFPIAIMLSLIPRLEKTWATWLESYLTILIWGITLSLISVVGAFLSGCLHNFTTGEQFFIVIFQFITMVCIVLSPTITIMLFGGSQAMNTLTQTMSTATVMALYGAAKKAPHNVTTGISKSKAVFGKVKNMFSNSAPTEDGGGDAGSE